LQDEFENIKKGNHNP